jgi:glyoxylase-like metal-dependent hydrolase (beta-lactamase superfamily II)
MVSDTIFRLDVLSDGEFRLDGGAMFGMVPRERWKEWCPPDDRNLIRLGTHALLVRGPDFTLLIEQGISPAVDPDVFAVRREPTLEDGLAALDLAPEDVTHVTFTHLHFDHAGPSGRFPNATYFAQKRELDAHREPALLQRGSYRPEDLPPADRLEVVDGDAEILPGVAVRLTGGHSAGHQIVILEDRAIYWGDLLPTAHHLSPPRTMAYDLKPLDVVDLKRELLAESAAKGWRNYLYHDLDPRPGRVVADGRRFRFER